MKTQQLIMTLPYSRLGGVNDNVSGVIIYDNEISKIAIAAKVVDFDSGNSGRDSHSLEVLEALKFPNIKFYSDDIRRREMP